MSFKNSAFWKYLNTDLGTASADDIGNNLTKRLNIYSILAMVLSFPLFVYEKFNYVPSISETEMSAMKEISSIPTIIFVANVVIYFVTLWAKNREWKKWDTLKVLVIVLFTIFSGAYIFSEIDSNKKHLERERLFDERLRNIKTIYPNDKSDVILLGN